MNLQLSASARISRAGDWMWQHIAALFLVVFGVYAFTPFFAPVLMELGATSVAGAIYTFYSTQCHQLPQRSYFLFGGQLTYTLPQIQQAMGVATLSPLVLRQFIGNADMGWKVAFSDRMVSIYTGLWLGVLIVALMRGRMRVLPFWMLILFILPLAVDGTSHLINDVLAPFGGGFRDTNEWLRLLTPNVFADTFYAGDAWLSFNSIARLATGTLAGLGIALVVFPRLAPAKR